MVSFTPRRARSAPAAPIQIAPATMPASIIAMVTLSGEEPVMESGTTAAAAPPTDHRSSPPITISRGEPGAQQSPVNINGAARNSVF